MDWRRAWLLVVICGVVQDPVRKLTGGTPVYVSFAVVGLYAVLLFGARNAILQHMSEFARRFPQVYTSILAFIFLLLVAALNGLMTYGFDKWIVPLVSLLTYTIPLVAALFGYAWLQREEMLHRFLRFYATVTSLALIGTLLEYMRVHSRLLGMVSFEGDYIRHLPGIQIRLLSGFYRSPDVMAWHAGMLTSIAIAMALRAGITKRMLIWGSVAGWGFFNCMIAGRRKAIYFVVAFALFFTNFSTFLARPGLYLEDLYVTPAERGRGIGKALLTRLGRLALERGCGRFEWSVLDWNEPALRFYRSLGADVMPDWRICRITGDALEAFREARE
jgi:GNAT superfamily N-acetyltransferase